MRTQLLITDLNVSTDDKKILQGVNLTLQEGETHAIMGPNGSGKSTLAMALMGHPAYKVTEGEIQFYDEKITDLSPDKRAKKGIFLACQYPLEIEGLTMSDFLRQSYNALYGGTEKQLGMRAFKEHLQNQLDLLSIPASFAGRGLNVGFSGGEKKRAEILQLAVLQPRCVILDEVDSGLDIDALKIVCAGLTKIKADRPDMGMLIITHYQRILSYLIPDVVHVMHEGKIVQSGGSNLALEIESQGYQVPLNT